MSERISVILPALAAGKNLRACLTSLRKQTWSDLEIILVNGAGQELGAVETDARVRVISGRYDNLIEAALAGVAASSGSLIGFADPGNKLAPDMYEKMRDVLLEKNADIAVCGNRNTVQMLTFGKKDADDEGGDEQIDPFPRWNKIFSGRKGVFDLIAGGKIQGVLWDKLFRRALFDGMDAEPRKKPVDWGDAALLELLSRAGVIVYLREPLYERASEDGENAFHRQAELALLHQERISAAADAWPEFVPSIEHNYRESLEQLIVKALETEWSEACKDKEILTEELWPFYKKKSAELVGGLSWQKRTKYRTLLKNPALFWKIWPAIRQFKSRLLG